MGNVLSGIAAGGVGTSLLNTATYVDMAVRGRQSSSLPAADVERLSDRAGVSLGGDEQSASARKEGLGALMGFVTGFASGAAFGLVRPPARSVPWPAAAALTGAAVMAATDTSSAALGTTEPRSWSASDWLSDLLPHLANGAGVVLTFDALERS